MPQAADFTAKDGAGTARTFVTQTPQSGSEPALWFYKAGSARTSFVRVQSLVRRSASNAATKGKLTFNYPVVDALTGIVSYNLIANIDIVVPDRATDTDVANLYSFMKDTLAAAVGSSTIRDVTALV